MPALVRLGYFLLLLCSLPALFHVPSALVLVGLLPVCRFKTASMATITTITFETPEDWDEVLAGRGAYPPLTTFFEPPAGCSTQWIHDSDEPGRIWSGTDGIDDGLQTDYFARCNPYSQIEPTYSPGICTSGQDLVEITVALFSSSLLWLGGCCDRLCSPLEGYQVHERLTHHPGA